MVITLTYCLANKSFYSYYNIDRSKSMLLVSNIDITVQSSLIKEA